MKGKEVLKETRFAEGRWNIMLSEIQSERGLVFAYIWKGWDGCRWWCEILGNNKPNIEIVEGHVDGHKIVIWDSIYN